MTKPSPKIKSILAAARAGNFKPLKAFLVTQEADDAATIAWATDALRDPDEIVGDVAASIFEEYPGNLSEDAILRLSERAGRGSGYNRFRAACALWTHDQRSEIARQALEEFAVDSDAEVSSLAKHYLSIAEQK